MVLLGSQRIKGRELFIRDAAEVVSEKGSGDDWMKKMLLAEHRDIHLISLPGTAC